MMHRNKDGSKVWGVYDSNTGNVAGVLGDDMSEKGLRDDALPGNYGSFVLQDGDIINDDERDLSRINEYLQSEGGSNAKTKHQERQEKLKLEDDKPVSEDGKPVSWDDQKDEALEGVEQISGVLDESKDAIEFAGLTEDAWNKLSDEQQDEQLFSYMTEGSDDFGTFSDKSLASKALEGGGKVFSSTTKALGVLSSMNTLADKDADGEARIKAGLNTADVAIDASKELSKMLADEAVGEIGEELAEEAGESLLKGAVSSVTAGVGVATGVMDAANQDLSSGERVGGVLNAAGDGAALLAASNAWNPAGWVAAAVSGGLKVGAAISSFVGKKSAAAGDKRNYYGQDASSLVAKIDYDQIGYRKKMGGLV